MREILFRGKAINREPRAFGGLIKWIRHTYAVIKTAWQTLMASAVSASAGVQSSH